MTQSHCETWWLQHSAEGMLFFKRNREAGKVSGELMELQNKFGKSCKSLKIGAKSSPVYLYSAFQQQGTQSSVHEEKHYNDTENQTQKNKSNDINKPLGFTGSWF
ncbi:hypothetical protein ATANTOWER_001484 [Ataeniobius toweri]|uniref:Uncharacterized protein n=1 Tax=Ataeniobius toweri TaxID=208326 RepID=A0ABU7C8H6_9TELE|nr:hypothetical protein [Ataeniobius toweri]